MATVVQAFILCATDDTERAAEDVFAALNGGVFESSNSILDFVHGVQQGLSINPDYQDGSFIGSIPGACLLVTANPSSLPI